MKINKKIKTTSAKKEINKRINNKCKKETNKKINNKCIDINLGLIFRLNEFALSLT